MTAIFTVQVPAPKVREAMPGELIVGEAKLEVDHQSSPHAGAYGREARRYAAGWSKGTARGAAFIEVRPTSKLTSEIVVGLDSKSGIIARVFGFVSKAKRLAELFGRALAYEIETRSVEDADGFDVRRTSAELVRARTA